MVIWYSGGVASAVAAMLASRDAQESWRIVRIWLADEIPAPELDDAVRLKIGEIVEISSREFRSVEHVARAVRFVRSRYGAPCSFHLKAAVRLYVERWIEVGAVRQVFGYTVEERARAERLRARMPEYELLFPLIEYNLSKADVLHLAQRHLAVPSIYRLGFEHNNCIGCLKASSVAYWRKVRRYFPEVFNARARLERDLNFSFVPSSFLSDLPPDDGDADAATGDDGVGCSMFCWLADAEIR